LTNQRLAIDESSAPPWGSFALVTYLPDPLGSFLTDLRHLLPGETRPDAHITFLPPRPLAQSLEAAADQIRRVINGIHPFEIELGTIQVFPETGMVYLSVETGREELLRLHDSLNRGQLFAEEHFEYHPHLTLGGPLTAGDAAATLQRAQQAWRDSDLSPRFLVKEMVLLWQRGHFSERNWKRISNHPLAARSSAAL
jgi:2'-5' RNA ligase